MDARLRKAIRWTAPALVLLATTARAEFGDPVPGLTPDQLTRFTEGREAFEEVETVEDGLGPVFNANSCATCHSVGGVGGGGVQIETRFGTMTPTGFDPMTSHGGSLIQTDGIGEQSTCMYEGEQVPAEATIRAGRRTTPLFGLGLVDAVPDVGFVALAAFQARWRPATAGRPNIVDDVTTGRRAIGKFGWKSQVPNLRQFSGDAYLNEMGITSPLFPQENCPHGDCTMLTCDPVPDPEDDGEDVELFHDFMSFLAAPPRPRLDFPKLAGSFVFDQIGCADCHVRTLVTGRSPVAALRNRSFQPFSDFLLHNMGSLGDGIQQGLARGTDMRTAPLWGLRLQTALLHDGRAATITDAILAHDGQGRMARNRFLALRPDQRARLLAFLHSL